MELDLLSILVILGSGGLLFYGGYVTGVTSGYNEFVAEYHEWFAEQQQAEEENNGD